MFTNQLIQAKGAWKYQIPQQYLTEKQNLGHIGLAGSLYIYIYIIGLLKNAIKDGSWNLRKIIKD